MSSSPIRSASSWPAVLASLVLAACGDQGGPGDPGGPTVPPVIDSATVLEFAGTSFDLMQLTLHTVFSDQQTATPNPFDLPGLAAMPSGLSAAGCVPVQTGVDTLGLAIDSDLDGVPDDYTADFGAGCVESDGDLEFTYSGKYRLQDTGGGILDVAYTTTQLSAMVRDTVTGHFFRQQVTGTEAAHFSAAHAAHQMDVVREVTTWSGGDTVHVSLRTLAASTFDPDAGSTFERHGRLPQGTLGLAAELTLSDLAAGTDSVRFVLSTPAPIHVAFACGTGFDGGTLRGLDEGDARVGFRFSWPACGDPAFEVFGTTP
jgi:hypothetical protein